jgi:ElaB/YqjD/DUF883 family membrane-anchored ribosome-binding protein
MSGATRYTRAISAEVGEIERRLRAIEKTLETISGRASTSARETAGNLGDTIGSALSDWASRFRQSANVVGNQSTALSKDAAKFGSEALNRLSDETGNRPLFALAIALGVGVLIGMAARNSR